MVANLCALLLDWRLVECKDPVVSTPYDCQSSLGIGLGSGVPPHLNELLRLDQAIYIAFRDEG